MGVAGQAEKAMLAKFQGAHEASVTFGTKATWWKNMEMITSPKRDKNNWWTQSGKDLRTRTGNKNLLSHEEEQYFVRSLDEQIPQVLFVYDKPGLPGLYQSAAAPLVKLQSFMMNYTGNYLPLLWKEMTTGKPSWAKASEPMTLPLKYRTGLAKHFIGGSIVVGAFRRANIDFSDAVGISFDPWSPNAAGEGENLVKQITSRTTYGVFNFRPSPMVSMVTAIGDATFGQDEYTRVKGIRTLKDSWILATGLVAPGGLAAKQLWQASEKEDLGRLIFRRPYVKGGTGKTIFSPSRQGRSSDRSGGRSSGR